MTEFLAGAGTVFRAVGLFAQSSRLRQLAVLPTLLSLLLLAVLAWLSLRYGGRLVDSWSPHSGTVHAVGRWLVVALLLALSVGVTFAASLVVGQPFIDPLCAAAEREIEALPPAAPASLWLVVREGWLLVVDVTVDLALLAVVQGLLLLLELAPGVGSTAHAVLAWLANAAFCATGMTASSLCRRGVRGGQRYRVATRHAARMLGLGSAVAVLMLLPLAQLLALPLAAVAGTLAVIDLDRAGRLQPQATS